MLCYMGAGYVGAINAVVVALANPAIEVVVVDSNKTTVDCWNSKHLPVTEEGLDLVIRITRDGLSEQDSVQTQRAANLVFSTDCTEHVSQADVVFLTVSTPTKDYGEGAGSAIDLGNLKAAVETIAAVARPGTIVVEESTVPCKTVHMIENMASFTRGVLKICCSKESGVHFEVLSNPEFLTEGTAVMDLLRPSRVLIGSSRTASGLAASETLASLYHWTSPEKILHTDYLSSELAKLVSNALLAQKISSINTISALCEVIGADITEVSQAVGMDPRIGLSYLQTNILGLSYLAASLNLPEVASYWKAVIDINTWQVERFVSGIIRLFHGTLAGKKLALFGYAFKENTSDSRESQSILVIRLLLQERLEQLSIYDPRCDVEVLRDELPRTFGPLHALVKVFRDPYTTCEESSAILILTP
ncbi:UDP-glucose/GDP-mannose dehydrogenase family, NAD binding domain-containing protein [Leptodontidium sp. 2 PMI_412]|nr:UDP-glucose/GDP-mannose dehydrogenase family, NAD binding domain-containing protein [Leptodontidium sp. 2 PMI_412]